MIIGALRSHVKQVDLSRIIPSKAEKFSLYSHLELSNEVK